jgi:hypothetical protein
MKISKTKLHQIIKEELRNVLSEVEDDDGQSATIYGPRAGKKLAGTPALRYGASQPRQKKDSAAADQDKTQEIDMDPHLNSTDPWPDASTFRDESERLFHHFLGNYDLADDEDLADLEILLHEDPDLKDIVRHLYGWDLNMFPKMREPNPVYVKVAQDFKKEGKSILDNEPEFLDRLEPEWIRWGKERYAAQMKHNRPASGSAKMGRASYPGTREDAELRGLFNVTGVKR